jgi:hypothetical protein
MKIVESEVYMEFTDLICKLEEEDMVKFTVPKF